MTRYLRLTEAETAETAGAFIWLGTVAAKIEMMAEAVPSPCAFRPLNWNWYRFPLVMPVVKTALTRRLGVESPRIGDKVAVPKLAFDAGPSHKITYEIIALPPVCVPVKDK